MNDIIVKSLKGFLPMLCRTRGVKDNGEKDKGGGRRSLEEQNAYDVVMTTMNNEELNKENLGHLFARQMKVSHREIKRGQVMRKDMEDMDSKQWIWRPLVVPKI